jgi:hypothetical protein
MFTSRRLCMFTAGACFLGLSGCDDGVAGQVIGTLLSVYDIVSIWV